MQTQTKEYAVEITINASATFPYLKADSEEKAKEYAISNFEENLIIWDCDFYEVTAEIEGQDGDRYQIQIEMEAQTVVYVQEAGEDEAEKEGLRLAEEQYYSLYSAEIDVSVSAEVMEE